MFKIKASDGTNNITGKKIAEKLYRHLWIYSHGIATLCTTKMCRFTGEEISQMITEVFTSLLKEETSSDRG